MVRNAEEVSLKGFDLKALDDAINAKNWLLRFPQKLETMFERDTGAQRCHELIVRAYIGIIIYDLFAFADWWVTPELFWTALWVRLAFFTPVSLLLVATLYRLGLNIASARLILSHGHEGTEAAGHVRARRPQRPAVRAHDREWPRPR